MQERKGLEFMDKTQNGDTSHKSEGDTMKRANRIPIATYEHDPEVIKQILAQNKPVTKAQLLEVLREVKLITHAGLSEEKFSMDEYESLFDAIGEIAGIAYFQSTKKPLDLPLDARPSWWNRWRKLKRTKGE